MTETSVQDLLASRGTTFAEQAGIALRDEPEPLFQLLVLCLMQAKPIGASVAVAASRELFRSGWTTPQALQRAPRSQMIAAFGRTGYRRYDVSTAARLPEVAGIVLRNYGGDLRLLRVAAADGPGILALLQRLPGVGPGCAAMFAREAQGVWPELAPFFDAKALAGAAKLGLPEDPEALGRLTAREELPRLAAALVWVALDRTIRTDQAPVIIAATR